MEKISTSSRFFYGFGFAAVLFLCYVIGKKLGAGAIVLLKLYGY